MPTYRSVAWSPVEGLSSERQDTTNRAAQKTPNQLLIDAGMDLTEINIICT